MDSMMVVMKGRPGGRSRNGSESRPEAGFSSAEADSCGRPVDEEPLADDVRARHRPPDPRIAGLRAVVAHEEVVTLRHRPFAWRLVVAPRGLDVRLLQ